MMMPKYMIVMQLDGETFTSFAEKASDADNIRMNCECGMSGYAEVYERTKTEWGEAYEFAWA